MKNRTWIAIVNNPLLVQPTDTLRRFWEVEDHNLQRPVLSQEEKSVVAHFETSHVRHREGRFIVPIPRKMNVTLLGDSRTQALGRLKRFLWAKGIFNEFVEVVWEYFEMGHAEQVPNVEVDSPRTEVYYFLVHAVHKEDSTPSKLSVVFDASAKAASALHWKTICL